MTVTTRIQLRRDTAANWTLANPTLSSGECGVETDTLRFKVGNGSTAWATLPYLSGFAPNATKASPNSIAAVSGISILALQREVQFIRGAGAITVTANPQITHGVVVGQELVLIGTSDSNTVTLGNGAGLSLNGACTLKSGSTLYLVWDSTVWAEVSRNDI